MPKSHSEKVLRLIAERNDKGKGPLSAEDRLAILTQMRDDSLCWAFGCSSDKKASGSGAARELYDFACIGIDRVRPVAHAGENADNGLSIAGLDPTLILVNGTGERIEA